MMKPKRVIATMVVIGASALPSWANHDEYRHSPNVHQSIYRELKWPPPRDPEAGNVYIRELAFTGRLAVGAVQGGHGSVYLPNDVGESGLAVFRMDKNNTSFEQVGKFRCHGVDVVNAWRGLAFQGSMQSTRTGTTGAPSDPCDREGLRIIDLSDPENPKEAAFIDVHCGVSVHALMPWRNRLYAYAPSTCREETDNPFSVAPLSELTVFRIFPEAPKRSRIARSDNMLPMTGCDRFVVHVQRKLAACAGDARFALMDLSDPAYPVVIDGSMTSNPPTPGGWPHLAFSWDGSYLAFGNGANGSFRTGKEASIRLFNIEDASNPVLASEWTAPVAVGTDGGVKAMSFVPMKGGRRVLAIAHGSLGFHLIDLTDASRPESIAYYSAAPPPPVTESEPPQFIARAAHWYNGRFFLTNDGFLRMLRIDGFDRSTVHHFRKGYNPFTVLSDFARG